MSAEQYDLPTMRDGNRCWINIKGWYPVTIKLLPGDVPIGGVHSAEFGRMIGYSDYILFEDERDAIMFKLSAT